MSETRTVKLRYLPTGHGRDYVGSVSGQVYTGLPRCTGKDVVEVDERDVPGLLALRGAPCCGKHSQPIWALAE